MKLIKSSSLINLLGCDIVGLISNIKLQRRHVCILVKLKSLRIHV